MYKAGIETRQNIINKAKKLFLKHGFKNTSVQQICQASNTKLGTFTYYFPKKNDLFSVIYSDYMQRCVEYVENKKPKLSPAKHHLYSVMLYYGNLYRNEKLVAFHKEALSIASMNAWFQDPRILISEYSGKNVSKMDGAFYDLCTKADNAVRRELNLDFIASKDHSIKKIKELLQSIYLINARLFGVDKDLTMQYLNDAYKFYLHNQDNNITLL